MGTSKLLDALSIIWTFDPQIAYHARKQLDSRMKIWIVEIGEPLPQEGAVRLHRYGEFGRYLAQQGHQVVWWSSTFSHAPKRFVRFEDTEEVVDGVTIRLIHGPGYKKNISLARFRHQADFANKFFKHAENYPRPDLIIAPVPTLSGATRAVQFARKYNIPVVADIRDFWPDEIAKIAPKPLRFFAKIALGKLYWQIKYICRHVTGILYMSQEAYRYGLKHGKRVPSQWDHFFPLGYTWRPASDQQRIEADCWLKEQGISEKKLTCCFFGTMGRFFDLELVIKAVAILEKKHDLQFILAGDGPRREEFIKMAQGLRSVIFPGWVDAPKIQSIMSISHFGLAPYKAGENFSLPNKPFEYMAGGLPILSSISQELPEILEKSNCGLSYSGLSVDELVEKIEQLIGNEKLRQQMGINAKELFEKEFSTEIVFNKIERHLKKILG